MFKIPLIHSTSGLRVNLNTPKITRTFLWLMFNMVVILILTIGGISKTSAANCDGMSITGGSLSAGTYTLTDDCTITETLIVDGVVVTINGNGFALNGGNRTRIFEVINGGTLNLNAMTLMNGYSDDFGGAIFAEGDRLAGVEALGKANYRDTNYSVEGTVAVNLTNVVLMHNRASGVGGAIFAQDNTYITIADSFFTANEALSGGGIGLFGGQNLTISNSLFALNIGDESGGGLYAEAFADDLVDGVIDIHGTSFVGNTGDGGAIKLSDYTLNITNSSFVGNRHSAIVSSASNVTITNTTISHNTTSRYGGGIEALRSEVSLINTTISANIADEGGGINAGYDSVVHLSNTIISDNQPENCVNDGSIYNDAGGNLEDHNTCELLIGFDTDPQLEIFNGSYYPLLADSPAIDLASDCLPDDQLNTIRPQGEACDAGAIEMIDSQ